MAVSAFRKDFVMQTKVSHNWIRESSGQYICPNASGSSGSLLWCTFTKLTDAKSFCLSDKACIGFVYSIASKYYLLTKLGFQPTTTKNITATFAKAMIQSNLTDPAITDKPNEYTCPNAEGSILYPPFNGYCVFEKQLLAQKYCEDDVTCLGYICGLGSCKLTKNSIKSSDIVTAFNDLTEGQTEDSESEESKYLSDNSQNLVLYISIPVISIVLIVAIVLFFRSRKQKSARVMIDTHDPQNVIYKRWRFSGTSRITSTTTGSSMFSMPPEYKNVYGVHSNKRVTCSTTKSFSDPCLWSVNDVCSWLLEIRAPFIVIEKVRSQGIDGNELRKLAMVGDFVDLCINQSQFTANVFQDKLVKLFNL